MVASKAPVSSDPSTTTPGRSFAFVLTALNGALLVSSIGDRLWAFSLSIFMVRVGGMTWVALFQMLEAAIQVCFAPQVGKRLDTMDRNRGLQTALLANNVSITFSAAIFYLMFLGYGTDGTTKGLMVGVAILCSGFARVASDAQKTAFKRDWLVVLIDNNDGSKLSTQNGVMTAIDQIAAFFCPLIAGWFLTDMSGENACLIIVAWNVISWLLEAVVIWWIYNMKPELAVMKEREPMEKATSPFVRYFHQEAWRAMFGLAILYLTVLGFDTIAISYGKSQGMTSWQVGLCRGLGSAFGFSGAVAYAALERKTGVVTTALIGLILQNMCLALCAIAVFLPGNPFDVFAYFETTTVKSWLNDTVHNIVDPRDVPEPSSSTAWGDLPSSLIVLFVGMTLARFGLWVADPAISQIMQETIPENERYSVNAAQSVFYDGFSIFKDVVLLAFPGDQTFGMLVMMSCVSVFIGFLFYLSYFITHRNSPLHRPSAKADVEMVLLPGEKEKLLEAETRHEENEEQTDAAPPVEAEPTANGTLSKDEKSEPFHHSVSVDCDYIDET